MHGTPGVSSFVGRAGWEEAAWAATEVPGGVYTVVEKRLREF